MSNSVVKSQVRYPSETHKKLNEFAVKHGYSVNEAVVKLVSGGVLVDSIDEPNNKDEYLKSITELLPQLSLSNTKKACMFISHLANMQSME
jgi:hypothetical protein